MATEKVHRSVLSLYGMFALTLAAILGTSVVTSVPSQLYFYSAAHSDDAKFYIYSQVNEPDLQSHKNLNMTGGYHYTCVVGLWLKYFRPNYTDRTGIGFGNSDGSPDLKCHQGYAYGSLRHVGVGEDISIPALNLYTKSAFEGDERLVVGDTPTLDGISYLSIYRMVNESWTLYTNENYSGASLCFNEDYAYGIPFPLGSIKKGC